jgi:hypothetical protein
VLYSTWRKASWPYFAGFIAQETEGLEAKPVTSKSGAVDFGQRYMHACQKTDINVSETAGFYKRGKAFQPLIHNIFRIY